MSSCIEFCGTAKKKNKKPEGKFQEVKPEIPVTHSIREEEFKKQDALNKLKYVEIKINDERIAPPPRGIDINIDM